MKLSTYVAVLTGRLTHIRLASMIHTARYCQGGLVLGSLAI